jgi:hypothetical protein
VTPPTATAPHPGTAPLTTRQAAVYAEIVRVHEATGQGCPASYVAQRFGLHHKTVREEYFATLHRKGWLIHSGTPAIPRFSRQLATATFPSLTR